MKSLILFLCFTILAISLSDARSDTIRDQYHINISNSDGWQFEYIDESAENDNSYPSNTVLLFQNAAGDSGYLTLHERGSDSEVQSLIQEYINNINENAELTHFFHDGESLNIVFHQKKLSLVSKARITPQRFDERILVVETAFVFDENENHIGRPENMFNLSITPK